MFQRHLGTHFKSLMMVISCKICEEGFQRAIDGARHIFDQHETVVVSCFDAD